MSHQVEYDNKSQYERIAALVVQGESSTPSLMRKDGGPASSASPTGG
jgi:hypothetical protein